MLKLMPTKTINFCRPQNRSLQKILGFFDASKPSVLRDFDSF